LTITACNLTGATDTMFNAYVDAVLDPSISIVAWNYAPSSLGSNTYRFQIGDLYPGQCKNIQLQINIDCTPAEGQTLCLEAHLYPADSCVFGTGSGDTSDCHTQWDRSSLNVRGTCNGDSVCFTITNSGSAMTCYSPIRVYVDGILTFTDSVQLGAGQSITQCYYANGHTIRLEVDQHPLHPGHSRPNAVVERCGNLSNWQPGLVAAQPQDDLDGVVDILCMEVSGSSDPNDKTGFPTGIDPQYHYILPDQQLEYLIRFQNTGTAPAYSVVIRDTLDANLDILSV